MRRFYWQTEAMTLSETIEGLYVAFASRPRREEIDGCPHCVGTADQERLARVPLRQLSADQLERFAFKAMTTWGMPEDYAHFLPRIIELSLSHGASSLGLDLPFVADKLEYGGWRSWPLHEQRAVRDVYAAAWKTTLASDPQESPWLASEMLPALARIFGELTPFLDEWAADQSLTAALQLAEVLEVHWGDLAKHGSLQSGPPIGQWLKASERKRTLEAAFERAIGTPHADQLATAIDYFQWFTP
jgi:hypothetical protein